MPSSAWTDKIPYDSRINRALKQRDDLCRIERENERIARETGASLPPSPASPGLTAGGDRERLRGIPAVGVRGGLGGAIAGTRPGETLD